MTRTIWLLCALATAACATAPNVPAGPLAWQDGYRDGCGSGESAAGYIYARWHKDVMRAQNDALYAEGWADGFATCKARFEHTRDLLGPVF